MENKKLWASGDLWFLSQKECNPDLANEEVQKRGNMRLAHTSHASLLTSEAYKDLHHAFERSASGVNDWQINGPKKVTRCQLLRAHVGRMVGSAFFQAVVLLAILFDGTLTILSLADDKISARNKLLFTGGEWTAVVVLSLDVLGRLYSHGRSFFKSRLNQFELLLVPVTLIEILALRHLNVPIALLRVLRPCFRASRILRILIRTMQEGQAYRELLRHHVSGDRVRFIENGFDLDLAYITPQIVATSLPGVGFESMVHNRALDVARFLNERHGNRYLLVNTTEERQYPLEPFFHRYLEFPIAQGGIPTLESLERFCKTSHAFLSADPSHVLVVHSKHGQGRVGMVVCALLLYQGYFNSVSTVISFFEHRRADPIFGVAASTQTLDTASQRRILEYFAMRCHGKNPVSSHARKVRLRRIRIMGLSDPKSLHISCFKHPDGGIHPCFTEDAPTVGNTEGEDPIEVEEQKLLDKLYTVIEECQFDSRRAGSAQMEGQPAFSSLESDSKSRVVRLKTEKKKKAKGKMDLINNLAGDTMARLSESAGIGDFAPPNAMPCVWEVFDTELQGEIRFEIHRYGEFGGDGGQKGPKSNVARSVSKAGHGLEPWWMKALSCCVRRRNKLTSVLTRKHEPPFQGMLFACWLHSDYLEYDEAPVDSLVSHAQSRKQIIVDLHRFDMDKGSQAPPLRSHSSALKLQLDFEVDPLDRTREPRAQGASDDFKDFFITSHEEVSESSELGWLSFVVKHLWPHAEQAVAKLLHDTVQPELQTLLPPPLNCIQFTDFTLGGDSPVLGPIIAKARKHEGFGIQLDLWVHYTAAVHIALDLGIAAVGINQISLHGLLSLTLEPISDELPVLNGIKIFFLNPPEIDINFTGQLEVANFSIVRKAIFDVIHEVLLETLVTPNMLVINWSPETLLLGDRIVSFQGSLPHSVLRLGVVEARDLYGSDFNFSGNRTSDPYAIVRLGSQSETTQVISANCNPVWDEEFDFLVHDDRQYLNISVYDQDFAKSDFLGQIKQLPLSEIVAAGAVGLWVPLVDTPNEDNGQRGRMRLTATEYDLLVAPELVKKMCPVIRSDSKDTPEMPSMPKRASHVGDLGEIVSNPDPEVRISSKDPVDLKVEENIQVVIDEPSERPSESSGLRLHDDSATSGETVAKPISSLDQDGWGCFALSCGEQSGSGKNKGDMEANLASGSQESDSTVALLVCQLLAGRVPAEVGKPTAIEIKVQLGNAKGSRRCTELVHPELANVPGRVLAIITRLAMVGFEVEKIADIVEEDVDVVQRIMRKTLDWNLEMLQRICALVKAGDLTKATEVQVAVLVSGREVGSQTVPVDSILADDRGCRSVRMRIPCAHTRDSLAVELDLDLRLFALVARNRPESDSVRICPAEATPKVSIM